VADPHLVDVRVGRQAELLPEDANEVEGARARGARELRQREARGVAVLDERLCALRGGRVFLVGRRRRARLTRRSGGVWPGEQAERVEEARLLRERVLLLLDREMRGAEGSRHHRVLDPRCRNVGVREPSAPMCSAPRWRRDGDGWSIR
jgi:hypothetical protein